MRRFSFHRRNGIIYCQLFNPTTRRYLAARSTGTKASDEALLVVADWLREGLPNPKDRKPRPVAEVFEIEHVLAAVRSSSFGAPDATRVLEALKERGFIDRATVKGTPAAEFVPDFLRRIWAEDGPYVVERRAYGHELTKRHIRESLGIVERYWAPAFKGIRLGDLTRAEVKSAIVHLSETGLAPGTVNKAFATLSAAFGWAARNAIIEEDPTDGIPRFASKAAKKGILEDAELSDLFALDWEDERGKVAFMVAATTGMRLGEVAALQGRDIGEDRLYVRHSWNDDDKLKSPKNGEEREAALLPEVRRALLDLLAKNPHGTGAESFIFYGAYPDRPIDPIAISRAFDKALTHLSLGDDFEAATDERKKEVLATWKARKVTFHSLRHGFAKLMADRLETEQAMKATGHLSKAMLEHYADHKTREDFAAVATAAGNAFGTVLSFSRAG
jgi:integrase